MALGPQGPEPQSRNERRLLDRAVFMGDWARTGKAVEGGAARGVSGKTQFSEVLEEEVDAEAEVRSEEEAPPERTSEAEARLREELKDSQIENRKDADRRSRLGGEEAAEKASAGMIRQPHPSMGLAMLMLPQQMQAQSIEKQGRAQGQRDAGESAPLDEGLEGVSQALLEALRVAGLTRPLSGFSDPRLRSAPELGPEWSRQDFPGGRICRWEGDAGARQVVRWSESEALLETTAAGQRQVLQKRGEQIWSEIGPCDQAEAGFRLPPGTRP